MLPLSASALGCSSNCVCDLSQGLLGSFRKRLQDLPVPFTVP